MSYAVFTAVGSSVAVAFAAGVFLAVAAPVSSEDVYTRGNTGAESAPMITLDVPPSSPKLSNPVPPQSKVVVLAPVILTARKAPKNAQASGGYWGEYGWQETRMVVDPFPSEAIKEGWAVEDRDIDREFDARMQVLEKQVHERLKATRKRCGAPDSFERFPTYQQEEDCNRPVETWARDAQTKIVVERGYQRLRERDRKNKREREWKRSVLSSR